MSNGKLSKKQTHFTVKGEGTFRVNKKKVTRKQKVRVSEGGEWYSEGGTKKIQKTVLEVLDHGGNRIGTVQTKGSQAYIKYD